MALMETLTQVFRLVFDDTTLHIHPETTANDIDGWDSLTHINLITAIEAEFRIRFTQTELLAAKNVADLLATIESKLAPSA
ncbi:acyl carrier protein [Geomesophilobacter sediminis]|uniref:Acyl carrier protein n=1 Tax=Geomesophilobacter sediminis TaxID=2798584 RepID=A0A8J7M074_9BACT|nr:acyl carrier protein [Geomesophilobacter sediminis]MBJ6723702.1 acyl carrier protein [Geomesophilobacter sediminis]